MAKVYLQGLPELKKKLILLRTKTEAAIAPVMAEAGNEITEMMKRLVPVDRGTLRDSIGWTFGEAPEGSIKVGTFKQGALTLTIYAGSKEAFYARWVEFGTHGSAGHAATPAQPFFYVSWRANRKPVKRKIAKAIQEAVEDVSRT